MSTASSRVDVAAAERLIGEIELGGHLPALAEEATADPYGAVILELLAQLHGFEPPAYLVPGALLDPMAVTSLEDVHTAVQELMSDHSRQRLDELGFSAAHQVQLGAALSELAQNILEHAGTTGWVAAAAAAGRVQVAVGDVGMGFVNSLKVQMTARHGTQWNEGMALQQVMDGGLSRYRDPGRGQGLKQVQRFVERRGGTLTVRTGRVSWVSQRREVITRLPLLQGVQVVMEVRGEG